MRKSLLLTLSIFVLSICAFGQNDNMLNLATTMIGKSKSEISEEHNIAKHPLVEDNDRETVYLIADGLLFIYNFDQNKKVKTLTLKMTRKEHYLAAQIMIRDSDWVYITSEGDMKAYSNLNYPNLTGILMKEVDPSYPDATYFLITYSK